jgi:hypothetical protein
MEELIALWQEVQNATLQLSSSVLTLGTSRSSVVREVQDGQHPSHYRASHALSFGSAKDSSTRLATGIVLISDTNWGSDNNQLKPPTVMMGAAAKENAMTSSCRKDQATQTENDAATEAAVKPKHCSSSSNSITQCKVLLTRQLPPESKVYTKTRSYRHNATPCLPPNGSSLLQVAAHMVDEPSSCSSVSKDALPSVAVAASGLMSSSLSLDALLRAVPVSPLDESIIADEQQLVPLSPGVLDTGHSPELQMKLPERVYREHQTLSLILQQLTDDEPGRTHYCNDKDITPLSQHGWMVAGASEVVVDEDKDIASQTQSLSEYHQKSNTEPKATAVSLSFNY